MKMLQLLFPSILLLAVGLTGCSSGGGDDDNVRSIVSGTANKGIIINGVVNAYKVTNGVIESSAIATGTTDDKGKYSLTIDDYTGSVSIVVTANANSQMKCDAINGCDTDDDGILDADFGATIPMPSDLQMEAVIPKLSGGTVKGSVNPLTHMAAAYAKTHGLGELGIQTANDRVEALFDVDDLLGSDPLDITDNSAVTSATVSDVNALKIAYLSAAVAKIAGDEFGGDVTSALNVLTTDFTENNGELTNNLSSQEGTSTDDNEITLLEITDASLETMSSSEVADNASLDSGIENYFTAQKESASGANEGDTTTTNITISSDDLVAAKAIVETVRTWATQLSELDNKGQLFADEMDVAQAASELAMDATGDGLGYATEVAAIAYLWSNHLTSPATASIAGKAITFDAGSEDEATSVFSCDGVIRSGSSVGDYLNNDNKTYIWFENDFSYIATIPAGSASIGQTWSVTEYDEINDITDTYESVISAIVTDEACDLIVPENLSYYLDEIDPNLTAATTGTVVVNGTGVTIDGKINDADINMSYTMPELVSTTYTAALHGTVSVANKVSLNIGNTSSVTVQLAGSHELLDELTEPPAFKNANFSLDITIEQGNMDDNNNAIADPVRFVGNIEASAVSVPGTDWDNFELNPTSLTMSGVFSRTVSEQSFAASFDATMSNASTFVPVEPLPEGHVRNDLVIYSYSSDGNVLTVITESRTTSFTFDPVATNITVKEDYGMGSTNEYSTGTGWSSLADYLESQSGGAGGSFYWYTYVDCEGEYLADWPTAGFSGDSGTIPAKLLWHDQCDEDETHWRDIQGELTMTAVFENLPTATVTANIDRTGYEAASGTVTFAYDDITMTLSGSGDDSIEEYDLNLLVTDTSSGSPTQLTIYPDTESDELQGSVVVNGNVVGTISEVSDSDTLIVNFIDGSFESVVF